MNIQNINRLNNEYRAYIYEAESHRITRAGVASREEGLSLPPGPPPKRPTFPRRL